MKPRHSATPGAGWLWQHWNNPSDLIDGWSLGGAMVSSFLNMWSPFLPSFSPKDRVETEAAFQHWPLGACPAAGAPSPQGGLFPKCGLFLALVFPGRLGCMWVKGDADMPPSGGKNPVSAMRGPGSSSYQLPHRPWADHWALHVCKWGVRVVAYGGSSSSVVLTMSNAWSLITCVRPSLETGTNMGLSSFQLLFPESPCSTWLCAGACRSCPSSSCVSRGAFRPWLYPMKRVPRQ